MSETLVEKIYEYIHEAILDWELQPDQRLHINQLAQQYEVGPGPIREALSRLSATGLVEARSQRGFWVAGVSQADLVDVYATRAHIEAQALKLSIEIGGDSWEANVVASYYLLAKFEEETALKTVEDYKEWEKRHRQFNAALLSACGLKHLLIIQQSLYQLTERYRRCWLMLGIEKSKKLIYAKKQKEMMDAALSGNASLACELLHKHYDSAVKALTAYYQQSGIF